jgi:hypothetical protein
MAVPEERPLSPALAFSDRRALAHRRDFAVEYGVGFHLARCSHGRRKVVNDAKAYGVVLDAHGKIGWVVPSAVLLRYLIENASPEAAEA